MGLKINYNNPLPDEYEREMPSGLNPMERHDWRKQKVMDLRRKGFVTVAADGTCKFVITQGKEELNVIAESSSHVESTVISTAGESSDTKIESSVEKKSSSFLKKTINISKSQTDECIRNIPKSVMDALRSLFPCSASKADLVSAAVYIVTNGACEISDKAMELVDNYESDDKLVSIIERLSHLELATKIQTTLLQSIELCTCFNTFDRRYGSTQPRKSPKNTDFREQDNLDMLECLREQAVDQQRIDELERGRQIYNQTKDKND